jgi:hypothetical protein
MSGCCGAISISAIENNITEDKISPRVGVAFESARDAVTGERKESLFDLFIV